jgi:hypothetical protein
MRRIAKRNKAFIFELKENRQVADSEKKRECGGFERLDQLKVPEERPVVKAKIYMASMKTAKASFQELWMSTQNITFA